MPWPSGFYMVWLQLPPWHHLFVLSPLSLFLDSPLFKSLTRRAPISYLHAVASLSPRFWHAHVLPHSAQMQWHHPVAPVHVLPTPLIFFPFIELFWDNHILVKCNCLLILWSLSWFGPTKLYQQTRNCDTWKHLYLKVVKYQKKKKKKPRNKQTKTPCVLSGLILNSWQLPQVGL